MTLKAGTRLGPHEILSLLGAGGMGEVYKGRDTRLDRIVALKVLSPHLADRPEVRERFEREAHTVANLKHPNICVLYDIGKQDGIDYLVLEYLEGETLAQRLVKGPLPLEQVLRYAIEISDALDKAHHANVTHRDIKPGNIMITKDGSKLLDFGLAKLKQEVAPNIPRSEWPTGMGAPTVQGTILGTPHYMAPEQAEGKVDELDARTDIFSFGATVYEMVTGKKAFEGKTQASVIAKILETDPPAMSSLQPMTPPALDQTVKRCLAKDPEDRWQTARDLKWELKRIAESGVQVTKELAVAPRRRIRERLAWAAATVAILVAVALGGLFLSRRPPQPETMRFSVATPGMSVSGSTLAVSPDGRYIAFSASDASGKEMLWIRPLDSLAARPLPGTERSGYQFWSPDSRFLGFFADGKLKKVEVSSGTVQNLVEALSGRSGTWNREGVIVFTPETFGGLAKVSAAGGAVSPVTTLDPSRHETGQRFPQFLPDGRHFLYLASSERAEDSGIYIGSLDSKETKRVLSTPSLAEYAAPGYLLFIREETLMAQPFDAKRLELTGEPFLVAEDVLTYRLTGIASFSVSGSGLLAYMNAAIMNTRLVWFDRGGRQLGSIGSPLRYGLLMAPELSPDGKRLAAAPGAQGTEDIWLWDLATASPSRFTFDPARDNSPLWSPDGSRIVFRSNRSKGRYNLYQKNSSGGGNEELLFENRGHYQVNPQDWSSDGRFLVYLTSGEKTGFDLWVLPLFGDRKPFPYLQTPSNESQAEFSSDGRWVAYTSRESGKDEVYVQSFPTPGSKRQVSTGGGAQPRWRGDGKELFYLASDQKLMAAPVREDATFEVSAPTALFQTRLAFLGAGAPDWRQLYDVTADGQRFLLNLPSEEPGPPITVVLNWTAGIKKQ